MDSFPFPHLWDPSRYARAFLMHDWKEEDAQAETVAQVAALGLELWHTDAGAKKARGRVQKVLRLAGQAALAKEAAKVQGASALPAGFSDLHGVLAPHGRAVYLEHKRPGLYDQAGRCLRQPGKPEPEQLQFLLSMYHRGAVVGVIWSPSDALAILTPYLTAHKARNVHQLVTRKENQYAAVV